MLKRKIIKSTSILCILAILGIGCSANAATEKSENSISNSIEKIYNSNSPETKNSITIDKIKLQSKSNILKIKPTRSQTVVNSAVMSITDSLTSADNSDFWFFNVDTARTMILNLNSINTNYIAQLGIVDWTKGTFTPTNIGVYSGGQVTLRNLPVGSYGIRVYSSTTSVGDNYTLRMNALNPSSTSTCPINATSSLNDVQIQYDNKDIYYNGKLVCNLSKSNDNLKWQRDYTFSYSGNPHGYEAINHELDSVKIYSVLGKPVKYQSSYASSNHALLLVLNKDTLFTYFHSIFQQYDGSDQPLHEMSFIDTSNKKTPRYFDGDDLKIDDQTKKLENYSILVYDLDTGKAIDFYSPLNTWYATGREAQPTITQLS